ncbi:MAG: HAD family hydrolase [Anaerolineales bacterium]|nr:HAD family hydrolase [Anaerolineales bacterium]
MEAPEKRRDCARAVLFDWGDTLMQVFPLSTGPMMEWPVVALMPGAAAALEQLHASWKVVLATNARDSNEIEIRAALERVGISKWIDDVYCYKCTGILKPDPAFFDFIGETLGLPPDRMVMVGDSLENDVSGAEAAGLHAVWYQQGAEVEKKIARRGVRNLQDLPLLLETIVVCDQG